MSDVRRVVVTGRVGQDAEIRQVGDSQLGKFSLAVNQYRGRDREPETAWWDIEVWGGRSKVCDYIRKGMKLTVEGELDVHSKTNEDGERRTYYSIKATNIVLPDKGNSSGARVKNNADERNLPF